MTCSGTGRVSKPSFPLQSGSFPSMNPGFESLKARKLDAAPVGPSLGAGEDAIDVDRRGLRAPHMGVAADRNVRGARHLLIDQDVSARLERRVHAESDLGHAV